MKLHHPVIVIAFAALLSSVTAAEKTTAPSQWQWAKARIDGESVVVWSDSVADPVAVRYAWANNPTCNLWNGAGFPAASFRTDDFLIWSRTAKYEGY